MREGSPSSLHFSIRGSERMSGTDIWGKSASVRQNCKSKCPVEGACVNYYSKNCKEASVEGSEPQ